MLVEDHLPTKANLGQAWRVLLVEDNAHDAKLATELLKRQGSDLHFTVTHVASLSDAKTELSRNDFDVIALDLQLPDSVGLDTFLNLHKQVPDVPVVIVTGQDERQLGQSAVSNGAQDYVVKSTQSYGEVLGRSLQYAIHRKRAEKEAERAVRESNERFRLLMSAVKDYAIITLDVDGRIVDWNEGAERIKGYRAEEIVGQHFSLFYPPEDQQAGKPGHELEFAAANGHLKDEGWRVRKDGSQFYANVIISALLDQEGKLRGFANVTRDITEHRRLEGLLQQNLIDLRRSNEDLEQFASILSHDLQEPLRVIFNFSQLLAKRYGAGSILDEKSDKYIGFIVSATACMQELIRGLLQYSHVDSNGGDFKKTDCSIVVGMAVANLKIAIEEIGAQVHYDALPTITADNRQLIQLFQNLIANGLKFRSKQPPEIRISAVTTQDSCTFTVQDNGLGLDMQHAERIFSIFKRLHTSEEYPGSGIGLGVCKKIVLRHGGRIWVESAPDKGSSFHFTLPMLKSKTSNAL